MGEVTRTPTDQPISRRRMRPTAYQPEPLPHRPQPTPIPQPTAFSLEPEEMPVEPQMEAPAPLPRMPAPRPAYRPTPPPPAARPEPEYVPSPIPTPSGQTRVEAEIARLQARLQHLEGIRLERLAAAAPSEVDTAAIEARLVHIARQAGPAVSLAGMDRHLADLTDPTRLQWAVVFHEILSRPKALRTEQEMWDF
jgi:hypothetical protein